MTRSLVLIGIGDVAWMLSHLDVCEKQVWFAALLSLAVRPRGVLEAPALR